MADPTHRFTVPVSFSGDRLDKALPSLIESSDLLASRALLQTWIREGAVTLNGKAVKPRHALSVGDEIEIIVPENKPKELQGEAIDLEVLYEDEDIIVVNKAPGMVVHPGSGNEGGTLVNALIHLTGGKLSKLADEDRPGIVHRLDKDTSGCLVAAKSDRAYESLVAQFSGRETGKEYLAVTQGVPAQERGTLHTQIGRHPGNRQKMAVVESPSGKEAITDFQILNADEKSEWALLSCVIHTGRTHQIRVHLKECLHCPIIGDVIYGQPKRQSVKTGRLMLHAWKLSFRHPDGQELNFESPLPDKFARFR